MVFLRSVAAGVVAAIAVVIGVVLFDIARIAIVVAWQSGTTGSGGIGGVSNGLGPEVLVVVAAFVIGFWWQVRRQMALRRH